MEEQDRKLYGAAAVRELDRCAIEDLGIADAELMRRAAAAAWNEALRRWPSTHSVTVYCGAGNNGGDGYAIAVLAARAGRRVTVVPIGEPKSAEAKTMRAEWLALATKHAAEPAPDLVVDALFGIGLTRTPEGEAAAAIEAMNAARSRGAKLLAVDVPSGLDADTSATPGVAVTADVTVCFIAGKFGLHTGRGPELAGEVVLDRLGVPPADGDEPMPLARLVDRSDLARWFPRRGRGAHKGDHGHVLVIGGDHGTAGAVLLAARAALRAGAGLVSVATRDSHTAPLVAAQPELMVRGVERAEDLQSLLDKADVVAIGPGLGQHDWGRALFDRVLATDLPLVVDADALNLLAARPRQSDRWILTPHPGEAARLLGTKTPDIGRDRRAAVVELQRRYGGIAVLKGAGSLVAGRVVQLCPYGNPGMGTGGMGDALTGVIAACVAQGLTLEDAAAAGVTAHALAGDLAARQGERGLQPGDLIDALREIVNPRASA